VTKRHPKDLAASVHQRLLNQAHATRRPFGELLQYYAMERFLYRLSRSPHADTFVLKGALMLTAWQAPVSRPTRDIDLLGRMDNAVDTVVQVLREVCVQDVQPDGLSFDSSSIRGEQIAEEAEYEGVRVRFMGRLGKARIHMQVDVGFGDVVVPKPRKTTYPTILDFPAPVLAGYSRESAVAEKLQVMVRLGELNSRMRDFYDIWLLSRVFDFDGSGRGCQTDLRAPKDCDSRTSDSLHEGVRRQRREASAVARLSAKICTDERARGLRAGRRRIALFLEPVMLALSIKEPFKRTWKAPGPWR